MQTATIGPDPIAVAPPSPPVETRELRRAGRWLWLTFAFFMVTLSIGLNWDRAWHTTHHFETFYSPPHFFIYGTTILTAVCVAWAAWSPAVRTRFPPILRHRLFGTLSGPVGLTGVGLCLLGFAGLVLDNAWHTRFGLDETPWSTPHNMLGWAMFTTALGFIACRLALRPQRPISGPLAVFLGWCVLAFSVSPLLGPLRPNFTPAYIAAQTQAIAHFPALAAQPGVDHVRRIIAVANLTRTNPGFVLLGALWVGLVLSLIRAFDRRLGVLVLTVAIWSLMVLIEDRTGARRLGAFGLAWQRPTEWLPPPIFPAALAYALCAWRRAREWLAWGTAGLTFGLCALITWGTGPLWFLAVLAAIPACILGARVGERVRRILEGPSAADLILRMPLFCVTIPVVLGLVDLWLRHSIP